MLVVTFFLVGLKTPALNFFSLERAVPKTKFRRRNLYRVPDTFFLLATSLLPPVNSSFFEAHWSRLRSTAEDGTFFSAPESLFLLSDALRNRDLFQGHTSKRIPPFCRRLPDAENLSEFLLVPRQAFPRDLRFLCGLGLKSSFPRRSKWEGHLDQIFLLRRIFLFF